MAKRFLTSSDWISMSTITCRFTTTNGCTLPRLCFTVVFESNLCKTRCLLNRVNIQFPKTLDFLVTQLGRLLEGDHPAGGAEILEQMKTWYGRHQIVQSHQALA